MDFTTSLVTISSSLKKRVPVQKCNLSADVIQVNVWKIKLSIPFFSVFHALMDNYSATRLHLLKMKHFFSYTCRLY